MRDDGTRLITCWGHENELVCGPMEGQIGGRRYRGRSGSTYVEYMELESLVGNGEQRGERVFDRETDHRVEYTKTIAGTGLPFGGSEFYFRSRNIVRKTNGTQLAAANTALAYTRGRYWLYRCIVLSCSLFGDCASTVRDRCRWTIIVNSVGRVGPMFSYCRCRVHDDGVPTSVCLTCARGRETSGCLRPTCTAVHKNDILRVT
jgi:hypothetical protein